MELKFRGRFTVYNVCYFIRTYVPVRINNLKNGRDFEIIVSMSAYVLIVEGL